MDLKPKYETPSKNLVNKALTHPFNCDSPFRFLPNFSTPPSRFTKIFNPFDTHLIERLHLPTFSPSVFAQGSTPKTDDKFKWTIDDISSLKPADIDEATIDQHVSDHDPTVESIVQEKINKFFNEKAIVPSPLSEVVKQIPLIRNSSEAPNVVKSCSESSVQTELTLPPILPPHIEEALKPFFTYTENQQTPATPTNNTSLYKKLFEFDKSPHSTESSPAQSTGLSPLQLSPVFKTESAMNFNGSILEMPELRDCELSPISRSACRLDFTAMSIDGSVFVVETAPDSTEIEPNNWDLEFSDVNFNSPSKLSTTPHSGIFTGQRKRLSESFRDKDVEMTEAIIERPAVKNRLFSDLTDDAGYQTGGQLCDNSTWNMSHMVASTPTKKN